MRPALRDGAVVAAACAACAAAASAFGPDANWDLRNYHLYAAWAWLDGRHAVDVAPAQAQSWFNPLLWVPHFLAFQHLGGAALAALVGALQGLCAAPLLAIAARLAPDAGFAPRAAAVAGGMTAATMVGQLGASYGDVLLALALLCAIEIALREADAVRVRRGSLLLAGALLGSVPALKLSHAPVALGLCLALPWLGRDAGMQLRLLAGLAAGAIPAFLLLAGPWAWMLWRDWGNPVFPQFDTLFAGDWLAPGAARDLRFVPTGPADVLLRPLAPLLDWRATADYRIRDARLPLLFAAFGVLALRWHAIAAEPRRRLAVLGLGFALAYAAWLALFGYHRYLVAFDLLAPLVLLAVAAPGAGKRIALGAIVLAALATNPPNHERAPHDWRAGHPLATPPSLAPDTLLVLAGEAPTAHLLPFLPRFAAAVRISSNLHGHGRPAARLDALAAGRIERHPGPLRLLADPRELDAVDATLARLGLTRDAAPGIALQSALLPADEPAPQLWTLRRLAPDAAQPRQ